MAKGIVIRRELLDRWRIIEEDDESCQPDKFRQGQITKKKEEWFLDAFHFLECLPDGDHIWCGNSELMTPLLETFVNFFIDGRSDSPLKILWQRISNELRICAQCICQHHQAQQMYRAEYKPSTIEPFVNVLRCLDEERVATHLKEINLKMASGKYIPAENNSEVVSLIFEVLMFPSLLEDHFLVNEFQTFIEAIDNSHELMLGGHQRYPGVYVLLFLKSGSARSIGHRLASHMGKLRRGADLDLLQPLIKKCIGLLETEVLPSTFDASRPRVQHERLTIWLGIKSLLGFVEPAAFEEGILEKYPIFLSIVLNHISDDTPEFTYAINCLRLMFEMLGCKLWLITTYSPSVMRNTLLGQCFHTRNEKIHKEIFDIFQPFLKSLESLQDGEHEKQRRHLIYFLLHQVTQSSNFSLLMRKKGCQIALLIILRGYKMNPPSPPYECAHMWGPSLISSLKDSFLHSSLRQPAFDLINAIIISDVTALISLKLKYFGNIKADIDVFTDLIDEDDEVSFFGELEQKESSCWSEFSAQSKLMSRECKAWACIPMLWFDALVAVEPSSLPVSFSQAMFWALSRLSILLPITASEMSLTVKDWVSFCGGPISSSIGWQMPKGSDDGGDGNMSSNSVDVSMLCVPLIKVFKRCALHFLRQMEPSELWKQWKWEPRMAESVILLLLESIDDARQVARLVLEHFSKMKGLTAGLQFLCSSDSSLSAIYLGLRFALKLVVYDSVPSNFHNLHHLFFVVRKLLKEVTSPDKAHMIENDCRSHMKFQLEGGFLHKLSLNQSRVLLHEWPSHVVYIKSWKNFCPKLSGICWPSLFKCFVEGKGFIDNKASQMTCVRALEILPVIVHWLVSSASNMSESIKIPHFDFFGFSWLSYVIDWGDSTNIIIRRHWRQCVLSLMNVFKSSYDIDSDAISNAVEELVSYDSSTINDLKTKVMHLSVLLASATVGSHNKKALRETFETSGVRKQDLVDVSEVSGGTFQNTPEKKGPNEIIVLSDEDELPVSANSAANCLDGVRDDVETLFMRQGRSSISNALSEGGASVVVPACEETAPVASVEEMLCNRGSCTAHVASFHSNLSDSSKYDKINTDGRNSDFQPEMDLGVPSSLTCQNGHIKCSNKRQPLGFSQGDSGVGTCDIDDTVGVALQSAVKLQAHAKSSGPKRQVIQLTVPADRKVGTFYRPDYGSRRLRPPRLDDWYKPILEMDYFSLVGLSSVKDDENASRMSLRKVPIRFSSSEEYVEIFRPLVLEEFKAQLRNSYVEASSPEELSCGILSILSVERIDDFHLIRCLPEAESSTSRGCIENDLVLLTKQPLDNMAQSVHLIGKVERREKDAKSRSVIMVIRFYLHDASVRVARAKKLLSERSKWYMSRIMSITPQLREFQALSSLKDIPLLPVILDPTKYIRYSVGDKKKELTSLPVPLQQILKSSFNCSQLEAIGIALGAPGLNKDFELSLIQGPPGTGKTRTIVAIISGLLALFSITKRPLSQDRNCAPLQNVIASTSKNARINQTAAVARAWQDAALAGQLVREEKNQICGPKGSITRSRVLICAQSNAAVDELVSRICNDGLYDSNGKKYKPYLVRVGNAKTVHPHSVPFFIDTLVDERLAEEKIHVPGEKNYGNEDSSAELRVKLEKLVESIRFLEAKRASLIDGVMKGSLVENVLNDQDGVEMPDLEIAAKLKVLYEKKKSICGQLASAQIREKKTSEEVSALKHKLRRAILKEAQIVISTLSGSGGDIYSTCYESLSVHRAGGSSEDCLFDAVVIDEAAQALEPATLIPLQLLKSSCTKCIMVGDPKQLPATVLSSVASKFLYECSMFERLQRAGHPVVVLNVQYRMHPEICRFPSSHFYDNKLLTGDGMISKLALFHENMYLGPYLFFDVKDGYERHGKSHGSFSRCNESEADAAVEVLKFFKRRYTSEFVGGRIGIITPYKSQLSLMKSRLSFAFNPEDILDMEFNTVDGFQGREVDILLLSTVRALDHGPKAPGAAHTSGIGFVADCRRMNVSLTRARLSLWIFGSAETLCGDMNWAALLKDAKERKLVVPMERPYKSIFKNHSHSNTGSRSDKCSPYHDRQMKLDAKNVKKGIPCPEQTSSHKRCVSSGKVEDVVVRSTRHKRRPAHGSQSFGTAIVSTLTHADCGSLKNVTTPVVSVSDDEVKHKEGGTDLHSGSEARNICSLTRAGSSTLGKLSPQCGPLMSETWTNTSTLAGKHKGSMARKRQRDVVEALLSSSLISSKPEISQKSASIRPFPSSRNSVRIKPSKLCKDSYKPGPGCC